MDLDIEKLKYPIGKFEYLLSKSGEIDHEIKRIEVLPSKLRAFVGKLSAAQLDTEYRPGGWTLRQVIHHLPDSHLNAYIRCKLALTEGNPLIKTYDEQLWALLEDSRSGPVEPSLDLLDALHRKWVALLKTLSPTDLERTYHHPDHMRDVTIEKTICIYAWHGEHHLSHIMETARREGWT